MVTRKCSKSYLPRITTSKKNDHNNISSTKLSIETNCMQIADRYLFIQIFGYRLVTLNSIQRTNRNEKCHPQIPVNSNSRSPTDLVLFNF